MLGYRSRKGNRTKTPRCVDTAWPRLSCGVVRFGPRRNGTRAESGAQKRRSNTPFDRLIPGPLHHCRFPSPATSIHPSASPHASRGAHPGHAVPLPRALGALVRIEDVAQVSLAGRLGGHRRRRAGSGLQWHGAEVRDVENDMSNTQTRPVWDCYICRPIGVVSGVNV